MSKISARDIQMFVAGALTLIGFRALYWLPYYFLGSAPLSGTRIAGSLLTGLALPIGVAMLLGRASAILYARVYLFVVIVSGGIVMPVFWHFVPEKTGSIVLRSLPELLVAIFLLVLIFWSRSRRFRHEPDA